MEGDPELTLPSRPCSAGTAWHFNVKSRNTCQVDLRMHGRRGPFIANKIAQCPQPLCPFLILAQSEAGGEGTPLFFLESNQPGNL